MCLFKVRVGGMALISILKDKNKRLWLFTIINVVLVSLYIIVGKVIKPYDLEFMDWVNNIPIINEIFIFIILLKYKSIERNNMYKNIIISTFIGITVFAFTMNTFMRFLTFTTDHIVHKNGKTIVITVEDAFLHTYARFYERKFFILKERLPGEQIFEGSYDPFERGELSY